MAGDSNRPGFLTVSELTMTPPGANQHPAIGLKQGDQVTNLHEGFLLSDVLAVKPQVIRSRHPDRLTVGQSLVAGVPTVKEQ